MGIFLAFGCLLAFGFWHLAGFWLLAFGFWLLAPSASGLWLVASGLWLHFSMEGIFFLGVVFVVLGCFGYSTSHLHAHLAFGLWPLAFGFGLTWLLAFGFGFCWLFGFGFTWLLAFGRTSAECMCSILVCI